MRPALAELVTANAARDADGSSRAARELRYMLARARETATRDGVVTAIDELQREAEPHLAAAFQPTDAALDMKGGGTSLYKSEVAKWRGEDGGTGPRKLPSEMRGELEQATGRSLEHVQLHDGAEGAAVAAQHGARAVAIGSDIHMGAGQLDAATPDGRELIAHEVAHVVQADTHPEPAAAAAKGIGAGSNNDAESDADGFASSFRERGGAAAWSPSVSVSGATPLRKQPGQQPAQQRPSVSALDYLASDPYLDQHLRENLATLHLVSTGPFARFLAKSTFDDLLIKSLVPGTKNLVVELKRLVAPESLDALVDRSRARDWEQKDDQPRPTQTNKGPTSWTYLQPVLLEVANAVARRYDESMKRVFPRVLGLYLEKHSAKGSPDAAPAANLVKKDEVVISHPMDGHVVHGLVEVQSAVDFAEAAKDYPNLAKLERVQHGIATVRRASPRWHWLEATPANATAEQVATAAFGKPEEAHRLIPMPPLWGFHAADAALMTPGVKKLFQTDAFMPSAPGSGMPRKLARALGLDWGADEVEDIDPVAELTSGNTGALAMQRAKARVAEKEALEAAGAGKDGKKEKDKDAKKPVTPAHDEADVYAELKDAVDLLDKIHLQLPLFGLSTKPASDAWARLNLRKEKVTKQSIPDVDAAHFLAFEQRGLLTRIAKGLADAGGKLVAAGGAVAPSTVRDPLREVAQPFHDAVVALELPEIAEPRVARAEQLLLLSQASILEAKLHEGMPQVENAKQGERIGAAEFRPEYAEDRTTNHLKEIALARRQILADPRTVQAQLAEKTKKVDDLEFEIGIGDKLAHLDQMWAALRDTDDFWLSASGGVMDTVLRAENRDIYTELQVRVFLPFTAAETFKNSTKAEDLERHRVLKGLARDAYREIVTSPRFVKHAQRVSKFLTDATKQKKWTKIVVGLGIAFAAFALGQWQFAAVIADGGGVFAAAVAGGVVTTGATVAMEKLILGHNPTIGSLSTGLIFNVGTFFVIGKLAEAARVAGVQAELVAGAKEVEAAATATKAAATTKGAGAAADATGAAATTSTASKAGKYVKGLTHELFVSEVLGVVQGQAASLIDQGRLLTEAELIELAIQGAVAVAGMRVGQAMHDTVAGSLRATKIESINRDVAWLDAERGEIAAQAKELESTKLDPEARVDRGKAFALLDRWRVYLERERAVGEKVLAYAEKNPKQFKPDAVAEMRKDLAGSAAEVNQVRAMASIAALEPIGPGSYRVEPAGLDGIIQQQRSAGAEIARVETDPYTGQRKITIKPSDGSPPFTITEALPEKAMRTAMKIDGGEAKPFEQWLDAESRKRPGDAQIGQLREIYLRDPRAAINLAAERNGYRPREMKVPEPIVHVDGKAAPHQRGTGEMLTNGHEVAQQIGGGVFAIADDTFVAQPHQVGELRGQWKEKFGHDPGPGHYDPAKNAVYFEGDLNVGGKRTTVRVQADLAPRIDSFGQLDAGTNRVVGQPVDLATGHEILRQLNRGEAVALKATGISGEPRMPADPGTEFGIGQTSDRRAVIIRGQSHAVDWIGLPGITPRGHTHPPVEGNRLRGESVPLVELISPTRDPHVYRELVFPSASDFAVMAQQKVDGHKVYTGFVVKDGMASQAAATDHTTPRLEFEIRLPKEVGQRDGGERVYHATAEGTIGGKGKPVIEVDVWATYNERTETGNLFMTEPPGVKPITAPKTDRSQQTAMASDPKVLAEKPAESTTAPQPQRNSPVGSEAQEPVPQERQREPKPEPSKAPEGQEATSAEPKVEGEPANEPQSAPQKRGTPGRKSRTKSDGDDARPSQARGYEGEWPPPEPGPRPPEGSSPEAMATWRYRRYVRDKWKQGKAPDEVLTEKGYEAGGHSDAADNGGRPGRNGGKKQVSTKDKLAKEEGWDVNETTTLGSRTKNGKPIENYVDGMRENPEGGIDYLEVDHLNKKGKPSATYQRKLASEIKQLGPNDTLTIVDSTNSARRIKYTAEDIPNAERVVEQRTVPGEDIKADPNPSRPGRLDKPPSGEGSRN
ncbi:MAG: DUF4157 domain-containing protein [Deltaproteobacteria bacterium]|nr:DUF4157 domain-containing protein [Deltaproteobacteria bacterium]